MNDTEWEALWEWGLTESEMHTRVLQERAKALRAEQAIRLAAWRHRNPGATCNDTVAMMLANLEATFATKEAASA